MKLIVCYTNKELINQTKILETLKQEMEGENFKQLINFGFFKKIKIHHIDSENELRVCMGT